MVFQKSSYMTDMFNHLSNTEFCEEFGFSKAAFQKAHISWLTKLERSKQCTLQQSVVLWNTQNTLFDSDFSNFVNKLCELYIKLP